MGAIMKELGRIADCIADVPEPELPFRMADFGAFGYRLFATQGRAKEWSDLLERVQRAQAAFASEGDGVVEALRIVLASKGGRIDEVEVVKLFDEARKVAARAGLAFPDTSQGFGRRLTSAARVIELELNVRFIQSGHAGKRMVSLVPLAGEAGGDGDDVSKHNRNSAHDIQAKCLDSCDESSPSSPLSP